MTASTYICHGHRPDDEAVARRFFAGLAYRETAEDDAAFAADALPLAAEIIDRPEPVRGEQ